MLRLLALLTAFALPARAEEAGRFDYYVLSLSWSPTWCAIEGQAQGSPQCDRSLGWILHGLWPQHEQGYPDYCKTTARDPSRRQTAAMADIMGTAGLAWHEWQKHGRCSGLSPEDYFALSRDAFESVTRPEVLRQLERPVRIPARVVEEAFLEKNPALFPDAITITCRSGRIHEARICLTRDTLVPRRCGADVIQDCSLSEALLAPMR